MYQFVRYVFGVRDTPSESNRFQEESSQNNNRQEQEAQQSIENQENSTKIDNDWILINPNEFDVIDGTPSTQTKILNQKKQNDLKDSVIQRKSSLKLETKTAKQAEQKRKQKQISQIGQLSTPGTAVKDVLNKIENKTEKVEKSIVDIDLEIEDDLSSVNIFDQLFVNNNQVETSAVVPATTTAATAAVTSIEDLPKSKQRRLILAKIQQAQKKKENGQENKENNKNKNGKSNKTNRNSEVATSPFTLNGNNALTLVGTKSDEKKENRLKKTLSKGQIKRQNKSKEQRNGPIKRQLKMFKNLNGIYYNRNNC